MTRTLNLLPFDPCDPDSNHNQGFNILIAYEDAETGKLAKKTYDFLEQSLGKECRFTNALWKFDVFSIPSLREMAAKDAANADIILFACNTDELSADVKAWIELWVTEPHRAFAVVVLFGSSCECTEARREVRSYLANVAKRGGMEFFAQPDQAGRDADEIFSVQRQTELNVFSLPGDSHGRETGFNHWGINE